MKRLLLFVLCAGVVAGCGESGPARQSVYKVSGTVTFHGSPLSGASITFSPTREGQLAAAGRSDDSGNFTVSTYGAADGAVAGEFKVLVRKYAEQPAADESADSGHSADPNAPVDAGGHGAKKGADPTGNILPPTYSNADTTPLTVTVTADGENQFELKVD